MSLRVGRDLGMSLRVGRDLGMSLRVGRDLGMSLVIYIFSVVQGISLRRRLF